MYKLIHSLGHTAIHPHFPPLFMEPMLSDSHTGVLATTAGSVITMAEAVAWTGTYQATHPGGLKSVYFSADVFQALLKQTGAAGIRIYNATNSDGKNCFVLVGATADGDLAEGQDIAYDKGLCCPDTCITSPLNHS